MSVEQIIIMSLSILLIIEQILAQIPSVKANSTFQLISGIVDAIAAKFPGKK